jgi:FtsH-binding integral membrane protein
MKILRKQVRRGFIRKVYGILMCQLIVTGAFISVFTFVDSVRVWTRQSPWLYIVALVVLLVSNRTAYSIYGFL